MYKKLCISICILFLVFITGCSSKKTTLVFENHTLNGGLIELYQFSDGTRLYSEFNEINYTDTKGKTITLKEALEKNLITIEEIIKETTYYDELNDGGSTIYYYTTKKSKFANKDFFVTRCNTINGVKDIIIGESDNSVKHCSRHQ